MKERGRYLKFKWSTNGLNVALKRYRDGKKYGQEMNEK
jgi:hypothetical protein